MKSLPPQTAQQHSERQRAILHKRVNEPKKSHNSAILVFRIDESHCNSQQIALQNGADSRRQVKKIKN